MGIRKDEFVCRYSDRFWAYIYLDISKVQNYATCDVIVYSSIKHWRWILVLCLYGVADANRFSALDTQETKFVDDCCYFEDKRKVEIW
jgi:hypothetical protein